MVNTVAVVVVTYNRLLLLKQCIAAIRRQTRKPDRIIVVDNGSTDGTAEWIKGQDEIYSIHQENSGGAGGFHTGMKTAFFQDFDWIWVMDDDGVPHEDCLSNLLFATSEYNTWYASPNLLDSKGVPHYNDLFKNSPNEVIFFRGSPFNAVLFKRELIEEIGFPNPSFFIWGDEYEYVDRIIEKGFAVITVKNAIHYHKRTAFRTEKCPRPYFFVRNKFWRYRAIVGLYLNRKQLMYEAIDLSFRLFFKGLAYGNFKQACEVIRGVHHGMCKQFNTTEIAEMKKVSPLNSATEPVLQRE